MKFKKFMLGLLIAFGSLQIIMVTIAITLIKLGLGIIFFEEAVFAVGKGNC